MGTLCFLLFFLCNKNTHAQSLTFIMGKSNPYGLYGSTDFTQTSPGLATQGKMYSLILEDNKKNRNVNPFIQLTYNYNSPNQEYLNDIYKYLPYHGAQVTHPWEQMILMGGARFSLQQENFDLFGKAGVGMGWFQSYAYNILADSGIINFNRLKDNSLVLHGGVGSNIYLRPYISLQIGYDFYYAATNFGYEKYSNAGGPVPAAVRLEVKPPFIIGSFYVGLRWQLMNMTKKK